MRCFCKMNIRECVYTYTLRGKFLSPACLVDMFLVYIWKQEGDWAPPWEFAFAIARREAPIRRCLRVACMREGRERKHTP